VDGRLPPQPAGAPAVTVRGPAAADADLQAGQEDLQVLRELIEAGKLTPLIGRTYPLGEVPEAMRALEAGNTRGKLVITV
jgi:NADPH:quinone reductase-like Zn-dependent oxidoreductase